jgi:antirestriction protein ArdC
MTPQERRDADRERLEEATRALMDSDGFKAWLETRSKFHAYSLGNQLLIAFQNPEATQVAGYKTWQKLGRQVRKGEKGLKILAPCTYPVAKLMKDDGTEETIRQARGFRAVSVFDISQTDGEALPTIPRESLTGDSHAGYLASLEQYAAELGYSVTYADTGIKGGWCNPETKEIVVSDAKAKNGQVRTLIHEIAHAHGVDYQQYTRSQAEVIVESVAYIVASGLGLDLSGETLAYVAGWGGDDDLKALKTFASTIDQIASKIEEAISADVEKVAA